MKAPAPIMLASPSEVHPTAILGEVPGRSIPSLALRVGSHAVIRAHSVIYAGCQIGSHLETGHRVVIREENGSAITSVFGTTRRSTTAASSEIAFGFSVDRGREPAVASTQVPTEPSSL